MKNLKKIMPLIFLLLAFACKEKYVPNVVSPVTGYLVTEGFINSGTGPTTITLTRTTQLSVAVNTIYETKANVQVEGKINTTGFLLSESGKGVYTNPQLTLNPVDQYRLHIKTADGREYVSDYSNTRFTPDIDSITWGKNPADSGVWIYANAHDVNNKTVYYYYKYDETWEFHSPYKTFLKVFNDSKGMADHVGWRDSAHPLDHQYADTLYRCWKTIPATIVVVGSSEKLTKDVISQQRLIFIANNDQRLSVMYSINVKQYALSKDNYRFLEQLKKNTEQLGTTFDQQPSDNNGNIHCLTNAAEPCLGFVEVSQEKLQRIFISNAQVPGWNYQSGCAPEAIVDNSAKKEIQNAAITNIPTRVYAGGIAGLDYIFFASVPCVDCRVTGSNQKPSFWP